jgi:transcriptional regulator with XRE-family HTH domain
MTTDIKKEFGKRVRYYRKLKHLTQSELSYKISKTEETISNIERGITESGIHLIEELASALGIQIRDFFNEDDIITPYLDKEKLELSREVIRLLGLKSKRYIKSIITILDEK